MPKLRDEIVRDDYRDDIKEQHKRRPKFRTKCSNCPYMVLVEENSLLVEDCVLDSGECER